MVGYSRYVKLKEVCEMRKSDLKFTACLFAIAASIIAAFALGMFVMWSTLNPTKSEVWDDGAFYYVETPDGNIWMYEREVY